MYCIHHNRHPRQRQHHHHHHLYYKITTRSGDTLSLLYTDSNALDTAFLRSLSTRDVGAAESVVCVSDVFQTDFMFLFLRSFALNRHHYACAHSALHSRFNLFISIQRRVANVYNDASRSAAIKAFIGNTPQLLPASASSDDNYVWMSAPPSSLVHGIDTGDKVQRDTQQHMLLSARVLNMISGSGGVSVSDDTASVTVSDGCMVICVCMTFSGVEDT